MRAEAPKATADSPEGNPHAELASTARGRPSTTRVRRSPRLPFWSVHSPKEVATTYVASVQTSTAVEYVTPTKYKPMPTPEVVTCPAPTRSAKTKVCTATETTVLVPGKTETTEVSPPSSRPRPSSPAPTSLPRPAQVPASTRGARPCTNTRSLPHDRRLHHCPDRGHHCRLRRPDRVRSWHLRPTRITTTTTKTDVVVTCPYETIHPTPAHVEPKETPCTPKEMPVESPKYDETAKGEPLGGARLHAQAHRHLREADQVRLRSQEDGNPQGSHRQ